MLNIISILFLAYDGLELRGKICKNCGKESCYVVGTTNYVCPYCAHIIIPVSLTNVRKVMVKGKDGCVYVHEVKEPIKKH